MTIPQGSQSNLAAIDRKLRELQGELARVFERPAAGAGDESALGAADVASSSPEPVTGLVAPVPVTHPPAPAPVPGVSRPLAPGVQAEALAAAAAPPATASAPSAASAALLDGEHTARLVSQLDRQIEDLQRLRDELAGARPEPAAAPTRVSGAVVPAATSPSTGVVPASPPAAAPSPAAEARPPAPAPPPAPPGADQRRPSEGQVIVNAGPFVDIGTLGTFEHALATIPGAQDVFVRSFEGNRALVDVQLSTPVHLVDEMREALPFTFGVVEVGHQLLTINVDVAAGDSGAPLPDRGGAPAAV